MNPLFSIQQSAWAYVSPSKKYDAVSHGLIELREYDQVYVFSLMFEKAYFIKLTKYRRGKAIVALLDRAMKVSIFG